jgi:phosphohistidine phosphatase
MLELYILRHGIAEPREEGRPDSERALTDEGRDKLSLVLRRAKAAGVEPALILTSPLKRAVQTAELAAKTLAPKAKPVSTEALSPGSSPEDVWREIRKHAEDSAVLIAGHEPLLGEAISFFLGANGPVVDLKKGALARVDIDSKRKSPRGILAWLITPKTCQNGES